MDLPSKHVQYLCRKIGARGAGSDGEKAAASYIMRAMDNAGIEVDVETFKSYKSDLHGLILMYLLALIAYLLFMVNYTASLLLAIMVFLIFQMETYTWSTISKLLPRSEASNVIGRVRAEGDVRLRAILVANYDTAKGSPLGMPKAARLYRLIYILSLACITVIVLVSILGLGASLAKVSRHTLLVVWLAFSPFPIYVLLLSMVVLWGELVGRYSSGANDNASGVGVMLTVLSSLAGNPLENTEVWGVATARGCAGGRGMVSLLHRHPKQMKGALLINLDHVGVGQTRLINREGVMLGFRSSGTLLKLANSASNKSKDLKVGKGKCRVKKSDAMVALARGYKAITIGGLQGGTYQGWKNEADRFNKIDRKSMDRAVRLVQLLLEEIDNRP
ncbi:MAG: M28 family peptidase [Actinobacteria bacterium]|nr:M28 family peptidase [Actinomycetota bacterium]